MMNLELLFWAFKETNDSLYYTSGCKVGKYNDEKSFLA